MCVCFWYATISIDEGGSMDIKPPMGKLTDDDFKLSDDGLPDVSKDTVNEPTGSSEPDDQDYLIWELVRVVTKLNQTTIVGNEEEIQDAIAVLTDILERVRKPF